MDKKITRGQFLGTSLGLTVLSSLKLEGNPLLWMMQPSDDSFIMTEQIQNAYELGLEILKPTKAQLERGLELHRNSLVFDTYGFMPSASVDGAAIAEAMNENASQLELQDMREEMSRIRIVTNQKEQEEFKNAFRASGVNCVFQNAGEEGNAIERLLKRLSRFTYITDMIPDFLIKAATPDDIVQAMKDNKHALYLTGNGVPLP
jgi:membrane dipeptidase